jgi:hypothetical protein
MGKPVVPELRRDKRNRNNTEGPGRAAIIRGASEIHNSTPPLQRGAHDEVPPALELCRPPHCSGGL